jgi:protein-S-isoprenylcysteine O-methyltransferase Ste14
MLILRTFAASVISYGFMAALIFWAAGSWCWEPGWLFLGTLLVPGLAIALWLAKANPELLRQRLRSPVQRGQEPWDQAMMVLLVVIWVTWLAAMSADGVRHPERNPAWVQAIGVAANLGCLWLGACVFKANSYAVSVVRLQSDRGQKVADGGVYRVVRHPLYAGALLMFWGTPLLFGSAWGFVGSLALTVLIAARAVLEERMLERDLAGYSDYAKRVRWRMIPGVW